MSLDEVLDSAKASLGDAGRALKGDLWKPEDDAFLTARAKDLVGLNAKAAKATDPRKRTAYVAAARDVINHVRLLAVIRTEAALQHVQDALGRFFLEKLVPLLLKALPALIGL